MSSPDNDLRVATPRSGSHRHSGHRAVTAGGERDDEMNGERRVAGHSSGRSRPLSPACKSPTAVKAPRRRGSWIEKRMLGSGGFGQVTLWQNESSGDSIALKICRSDLSETNKHRWRVEVEMMYRLRHCNVVTAKEVPDCFADLVRKDLTILGMEWCDKGNLRQCFSLPQNCCGLQEVEVLLLMKDIAGAVEYLHEQRIIHRDIKPENIVLKEEGGRVVHKLIDLGYAKELDQTSMAKSFVGTFVYLAPELFLNAQHYTRTVDYWNFGSIVYEAITGQRPFPDFSLSPITWHQRVSAKGKHDICMYKPRDSKFVYSQDIIPPHWLTRPMEALLTDWLRLMLQLDAHMRGGVAEANRRPEAFNFLDRIFSVNIVQFHCINLNSTVAFEASSNDCITVYQNQLAQEWQIPKDDQLIFDRSGWELEPQRLVLENVTGRPSLLAGEGRECYRVVDYYVLNKQQPLDADVVIEAAAMPPPVVKSFIMEDPHAMLSQEDCSRIWPLAINFCQKQLEQCKALLSGSKAILFNCMRENTSVGRLRGELATQCNQLEGILEFFVEDLRRDVLMMKESLNGQESNDIVARWNLMLKETSEMKAHQHLSVLDVYLTDVSSQMSRIQSNQTFQSSGYEAMEEIVTKSKKLLLTVKRQAKEMKDSQAIAECVSGSIRERNELIKQLFYSVGNMMSFKSSASQVMAKVKAALESVQKCRRRLSELQQLKQQNLWDMVKSGQSVDPWFSRPNKNSVSRSDSMASEGASATSSVSSVHLASLAEISRQNSGAVTKAVIEEAGSTMTEFSDVIKQLHKHAFHVESLSLDSSDAS